MSRYDFRNYKHIFQWASLGSERLLVTHGNHHSPQFTLLPGCTQCHLGPRMLGISGRDFLGKSSGPSLLSSARNEPCLSYSHNPPRSSESHLIQMKHILQILIFLSHLIWTKGKQQGHRYSSEMHVFKVKYELSYIASPPQTHPLRVKTVLYLGTTLEAY